MEISSGPSSPALDAARAEMKDMATNPQNPRHAGYQRGDREVQAYLDQLYKKAVPDSAPPVPLSNEGRTARTGGPDDAAPALSPEDAEAFKSLQGEWGEQFQEHHADAQFGMSRITRVFGGEADDLTAAVLAAGGDLKLVMNILRHFGKQARTYAP
jgi:hypothetical protein